MSTYSRVTVIGRLGARITSTETPNGDERTSFTVIVDRPARERDSSVTRVDAIPCVAVRAAHRALVHKLEPGTPVSVDGTLRRRFWRNSEPGGIGTTMEVQVRTLTTHTEGKE